MPIFCVRSVKIYTGQKKIYTSAARGARDKYEVWRQPSANLITWHIDCKVWSDFSGSMCRETHAGRCVLATRRLVGWQLDNKDIAQQCVKRRWPTLADNHSDTLHQHMITRPALWWWCYSGDPGERPLLLRLASLLKGRAGLCRSLHSPGHARE